MTIPGLELTENQMVRTSESLNFVVARPVPNRAVVVRVDRPSVFDV